MADAKIMESPTFDADGYPTDETLDAIRLWPWEKSKELFAFLQAAWKYPECFNVKEDGLIEIATGGWSGNESLIYALEENALVHGFCWELSRRGGYYEYRLPELPREA